LVTAGFFLSLPVVDRPAGWIAGGWQGEESRWWDEEGSGLALDDRDPSARALLEQTVTAHNAKAADAIALRLVGNVRAPTGSVEVSLRLDDGVSAAEAVCVATAEWRPCELTAPAPTGGRLRVVLAVGAKGNTGETGQVRWQRLQLVSVDDPDDNLLENPDGRVPSRRIGPLRQWGERILRAPRGWATALTRPEVWSTGALLRYAMFSVLLAGSFWGNFGWLQAPLPWALLLWLTALGALGLAGSVYRVTVEYCRRAAGTSREGAGQPCRESEGSLLFAICAVALIALQTVLPMIGFSWQPQGRYLLPALLPLGVVLLVGLRQLLPSRWKWTSEWIVLGSLVLANVAMVWVIDSRW
jgi:hypothetical protein